jgi:hypothetical protein
LTQLSFDDAEHLLASRSFSKMSEFGVKEIEKFVALRAAELEGEMYQ